MSLCLALLLAVIAINWWQGWKPFKHPLQMPGNVRLTRLFNLSQPAQAIEQSRRAPPRRLSPTAVDRLQAASAKVSPSSISLMMAVKHGHYFLWPAHRQALRAIWVSHTFRHYRRLPDRLSAA